MVTKENRRRLSSFDLLYTGRGGVFLSGRKLNRRVIDPKGPVIICPPMEKSHS